MNGSTRTKAGAVLLALLTLAVLSSRASPGFPLADVPKAVGRSIAKAGVPLNDLFRKGIETAYGPAAAEIRAAEEPVLAATPEGALMQRAAAAVANAVHHATGIRVRELPIQPDKLLPGLPLR